MRTIIRGGTIVNEGRSFKGGLVIEDDSIAEVFEGDSVQESHFDNIINAKGCVVLPGIIDEHVHFREPGLTSKADIESESRAAAFGGVTSYLEMPNTIPQTTTLQALYDKYQRAKSESHVNYGFFFGATNDNVALFGSIDPHTIPGIKLFMGSSTGNMLVDKKDSLQQVFKACADLHMPLMTHCEDTEIINRNMAKAKSAYGDDPDISHFPDIRSTEACYKSSKLAVALSAEYGTHLHIAHVSTASELEFALKRNVTLEAVAAHLIFCEEDYTRLGALIKCNPSIKTRADRAALRLALSTGRIYTIGTDHAPHLLEEKQGGCAKAKSGMPMIQFSLPAMLELVDNGILTIEHMVELMAHNPARLFGISGRGFLRPDYKADITVVKPNEPWTVNHGIIQSKCGWSPMEGHTFNWKVMYTICNGHRVYDCGHFDNDYTGEKLEFKR